MGRSARMGGRIRGFVHRDRRLKRFERHDFTFDGLDVRVTEVSNRRPAEAEEADEETFVLIHGLGVSSSSFVPLCTILAKHGRVLMFDLPGFGGVPRPRRRLRTADFAEVVRRTLNALHLENPVIVGHSMGSQIVTELLATHGGLASHAVLVGPIVTVDQRTFPALDLRFSRSARHETLKTSANALAAYAVCGPTWFTETLPSLLAYQTEDRIVGVGGEVLLVSGEHDATSPEDWLHFLARQHPRARAVVIEGASHMVITDHTAELAEEILGFIGVGTAGVV